MADQNIPKTQLVADFGDLLTAYLRDVREGLPIEQAYDGTRLLSQFEVDRERAINGGGYVQTQISASLPALGAWYEGDDTIGQDKSSEDTMAQTELKMISEPIRVTREEILKTGPGPRSLYTFMQNKFNQGMRRLRIAIESGLMAGSQNAKAITSFLLSCAVDPTTGTVDGINRATAGNEYWRNQSENIGSLTGGGYEKLEKLSLDCQKGGESDWDYGFCDSQTFLALKKHHRQFLEVSISSTQSALGKRMVDLSIPVIEFEGKPIFWSPRVPNADGLSGLLYLVRKDAFDLAVHPDEEFKLLGPFPMENQNKHGMKWHLMWAGQLCWKLPSACGVGHSIAE